MTTWYLLSLSGASPTFWSYLPVAGLNPITPSAVVTVLVTLGLLIRFVREGFPFLRLALRIRQSCCCLLLRLVIADNLLLLAQTHLVVSLRFRDEPLNVGCQSLECNVSYGSSCTAKTVVYLRNPAALIGQLIQFVLVPV